MLHECLVIDNSNFFKNGTIRVRVKDFVMDEKALKDMSENPVESVIELGNERYEIFDGVQSSKKLRYDDEDVLVSSSLGAGYDYGLFVLPQPNTRGLVAEISDICQGYQPVRMVWIGGIFQHNQMTGNIPLPSDIIGEQEENVNGFSDKTRNIKYDSSIVLKQKETKLVKIEENGDAIDGDKSALQLDLKIRPTQNMVVLDKEKIFVVHKDYNEKEEATGKSELKFDKNGIDITYTSNETNTVSNFYIRQDGSFALKNESGENKNRITNTLEADDTSITLSHTSTKDKSHMELSMGSQEGTDIAAEPACKMIFTDQNFKVPAEIIMNKSGITINSNGNISINSGNGGTVSLGTGEGYILTSNIPGTFDFDNHTVTAVKTAKA